MLVGSRALWYNYIQHLHVNVADEDSRRLRDGDGGGGVTLGNHTQEHNTVIAISTPKLM